MKNEIEELENIHKTFPDDENLNGDKTKKIKPDLDEFELEDDQPKQNFVTEMPIVSDETKSKRGLMLPVGLVLGFILIFGVVALFFIFGGKSANEEIVKDNSLKTGVNANSANSASATDFGADYKERYGTNSASNASTNSNSNSANDANSAGSPYGNAGGITAPPPPNYNGSIYQTPGSPNDSNAGSPNNNAPANSIAKATVSRPAPEETTTRIKPNRQTEIVELPTDKTNPYQNGTPSRNDQVSLFFYEKESPVGGSFSRIEYETSAPVKPVFGTVLPIRVLGKLHTLGTNGFARMELTRTVSGSWGTIPRGTIFVGRVSGGEANRLFVSLIGYFDSRSNRLVTLGGDLQGIDGALGLKGDVKKLGSRWTKVFGEILSTAKQIGSAYLLGRTGGSGTVINNGQLENVPNALENKEATRFVVVPAGANGYIVLNELPPAVESDERLAKSAKPLSDDEILKLIQTDSNRDIETLMPNLSEQGRSIAKRGLVK